MNVGINGFGRIGRAIFRLLSERDDIKIKVINDINKDKKMFVIQLNMILFMVNLKENFKR